MSSVPPPVPPRPAPPPSGGGGNKAFACCAIGCGLLLVLLVAGLAFVYFKVGKPMMEFAAEMEKLAEENRTAARAVGELDQVHASELPEDLATAEPSSELIDRYLAVRSALGTAAKSTQEAHERVAASLDMGKLASGQTSPTAMFGMVGDVLDAMKGAEVARGALLVEARDVLDRERMGSTDFRRMLEIVEWRFLRRPEAQGLALSPGEQARLVGARFQVSMLEAILQSGGSGMGADDRAELERQLDQARDTLRALEAQAESAVGLSEPARELLESRRAELEAVEPAGLDALATLAEPESPWAQAMAQGGGPFGGFKP